MEEQSPQFFLSALSHEIRTPLNGIVGYCQLLSQTKLDSTQQTYISRANKCCIQLVEIVNDILDFSKLSMGKGHISQECFSIKEIIEEVNSVISQMIKEKKQKIRYVVEKDIPEYIATDKQKLTQVLINLISNASKFSPTKGRIIINISSHDNYLEISVEDNGIGISEDNQKKLFMPFVQLDESKVGNGLGLAISKKLVELLGGIISVSSEPGKGSIFTFNIKFNPIEQIEKEIEKNSAILRNTFILVVDDNIDNRLILSEMMFEYGIKVITCASGKETLKILPRYPFVLAIINICLPDMTGSILAGKIKDVNNDLPIVGLLEDDNVEDGKLFNSIITKPINKIRLLDTICNLAKKNSIEQFDLENEEKKKEIDIRPGIKILIAEDIGYNQEMLTKMLNNMDYKHITIAKDGVDAIQKLKEDKYDILLLDLKMPNIDGFGVASYIRENNLPIKIAVITASVLENDKERCKELGIKYFLLKPFNMSHLKHIMHKLVHGTSKK
jgi:CheY-like chemotaxis protein/two-component sensor histidine kinase